MPVAVFFTKTLKEAISLFCRLYKKLWSDLATSGYTFAREQDVPTEKWDIIHKKYKEKDKVEAKKAALTQIIRLPIKTSVTPKVEITETFLETSKYMPRR